MQQFEQDWRLVNTGREGRGFKTQAACVWVWQRSGSRFSFPPRDSEIVKPKMRREASQERLSWVRAQLVVTNRLAILNMNTIHG